MEMYKKYVAQFLCMIIFVTHCSNEPVGKKTLIVIGTIACLTLVSNLKIKSIPRCIECEEFVAERMFSTTAKNRANLNHWRHRELNVICAGAKCYGNANLNICDDYANQNKHKINQEVPKSRIYNGTKKIKKQNL